MTRRNDWNQQKCMSSSKLELFGFRFGTGGINIHYIRELTDDEVLKYHEFTSIYAIARNRFLLFRILQGNYAEWEKFLLSCKRRESSAIDEMVELDRLMLNLLTSARALIDHFTQYYVQTFRNTPAQNDFNTLIERLNT